MNTDKKVTWVIDVYFVLLKINKQYTRKWKDYVNGT